MPLSVILSLAQRSRVSPTLKVWTILHTWEVFDLVSHTLVCPLLNFEKGGGEVKKASNAALLFSETGYCFGSRYWKFQL